MERAAHTAQFRITPMFLTVRNDIEALGDGRKSTPQFPQKLGFPERDALTDQDGLAETKPSRYFTRNFVISISRSTGSPSRAISFSSSVPQPGQKNCRKTGRSSM
jgi:hypothetical protein